ncbi:MAG: sigma-E processing peptidase SpoIIGA [Clostridiales bacterium]|jgi:stage II sporulation protein GA (sporulation sigma-E factor processing peptidase)|nr:sigma-E processing peptidase SpoIIGA [Clostridiales bacterium]
MVIAVAYVYADVLFLLNFCVDFAVMRMTGGLLKRGAKTYRIALGAAFASFTYCVFFTMGITGAALTVLSLVGMLAGLFTGFAPVRFRTFAVLAVCAFLLTFALGGVCFAVYFAFLAPAGIPAWLLAAAAGLVYAAERLIRRRIERTVMNKAAYADVTVGLMGKEASFTALVDTGHRCLEPISRWPVIAAEYGAVKALFPQKTAAFFDEERRYEEADLERAAQAFRDGELDSRMRIIPFRALGSKNGVLVGFRPDYYIINGHKAREAVVGIYSGILSADGEYRALLNPALMKDNGVLR